MRLTIAAIGRLKAGPERELFQRYRERVDAAGRRVAVGPCALHELAESARGSAEERRREEGERLAARLSADAVVVALDEAGEGLRSDAFAGLLGRLRDDGAAETAFAIGGPDGHGEAITARAARVLSLGPMTLPHGLVRIVLAEQLYRAVTMLAGHPYHRV